MRKLLMLAVTAAGAVLMKRQKQASQDADLWREATKTSNAK